MPILNGTYISSEFLKKYNQRKNTISNKRPHVHCTCMHNFVIFVSRSTLSVCIGSHWVFYGAISYVPIHKISFNHHFLSLSFSQPANFLHSDDNYFDFVSKQNKQNKNSTMNVNCVLNIYMDFSCTHTHTHTSTSHKMKYK